MMAFQQSTYSVIEVNKIIEDNVFKFIQKSWSDFSIDCQT